MAFLLQLLYRLLPPLLLVSMLSMKTPPICLALTEASSHFSEVCLPLFLVPSELYVGPPFKPPNPRNLHSPHSPHSLHNLHSLYSLYSLYSL